MKKVNTHEAKTHLSKYLELVERGETLVICRRNVPVAELRPISTSRAGGDRPIGLAKSSFHLPESFFDDLPEEIVGSFEGEE